MEDPKDPNDPLRYATQLSRNNDPAPEEDQHYHDALETHLQIFLPLLTQIINYSEQLKILPDQVSMLQSIHELVTDKRLSLDRLKNIKEILYYLYDAFGNSLNFHLPPDFKTCWVQGTKSNGCENKVSSAERFTPKKINQNQNRESELPNNIQVPGNNYKIVNDKMGYIEDLNTINKNFGYVNTGNLYDNNISMLAEKDLPKFSDSRLKLNKIIGIAINDLISKLDKSDESFPYSEYTSQISDEMIKHKNDQFNHKDILKGININNIDINCVKDIIDGIKKAGFVEPIQHPPSPPLDPMNLRKLRRHSISTTEPNTNVIKSSTIIPAQLNTEINKFHKTGLSDETKQKLISALKPGTLIDLKNSKVIRSSLDIETLRPVIISNEKSTDIKTFTDIGVSRDPRLRNKSLLSSQNNVSPFNPASSISNLQYSTNISIPFAPNEHNLNVKLFETKAQEISGYNSRSSSSHTNIKLQNPQLSSEDNRNVIQLKNQPFFQNLNKLEPSVDKEKDYSQLSNSSQNHVNPSYTETLTKYCDPLPYKSDGNDTSKRDPKILKNVNKTQYPSYKEYREAKYREQNKGLANNKNQINQDQDKCHSTFNVKMDKYNIISSSYNSFGRVNETASIKNFKIPKIKHKGELNDSAIKEPNLKTFTDNKNRTDILKYDKKSEIPLKTEIVKEQHLKGGQKFALIKANNLKNGSKITDESNGNHTVEDIEIITPKISNTDRDMNIQTIILNKKSKKYYSCPKTNLEEISISIPNKISNDELDVDNVLIPNLEDVKGQNEIKHNVISSPSKEQPEAIDFTTEIFHKSQEKSIVSSTEINPNVANNPKIDDKNLVDILNTSIFLNSISIFQDEDKMKKLEKLLENSDVKDNDDKSKQIDLLNKEKFEIKKRKLDKEKEKQRKKMKNVSKESMITDTKNKFLKCTSDDNNIIQPGNIVKTREKKSNSPTDQYKYKSKESYDNFEIRKDKSQLKDLKIVIAKLDKNIKRNEICDSDISNNDNIQGNVKQINVEVAQDIKPKKPFSDPLSTKLAVQKMEMKLNNSQNDRYIQNQHEFETKKVKKNPESVDKLDKKEKLNSETLTSLKIKQPNVLIRPFQNPNLHDDETNSNKSVEQNPNTSNFIVNKAESKKARQLELDKFHADISEMFDCNAVLNASNIRHCRTNKKIDYFNSNLVNSENKKISNIEELDLNDDQNKFIKLKNTRNKVQESKVLLDTKEQSSKKSVANKYLPLDLKSTVLNKMSIKQFKKKRNKKFKKSKVVLYDGLQSKNKTSTKITSTIVSEKIYKDKFYFQTADNSLECKFCDYKDTGLNIVRHYKVQHCGEEVLPSRLAKNCTESLIQQSLNQNFGFTNFQDSKPYCFGSVNVNYTCVFCQAIFYDNFKFYDHITGHTGEYRYKCKMCEQVYSNEDDLDKHILEHTDYDKTNGISHLIFPNPIWGKYIFGYLCSFCYYIQLNYNNIIKHMAFQHLHEDKKLNGHWTVIRVSMSMSDKINTDYSIDFDNLVGCLPPIKSGQIISKNKDNDDQNQQLTVKNEQKQSDSSFSIQNICNEQNIDKIIQKTIVDENPSKSLVNPLVSVNDEILPESNILKFFPEQANQSSAKETRMKIEQDEFKYSEYTLTEKSKKCDLAGLICEVINSVLLFKCSVSNCLENQFSTLVDFYNHIIQYHKYVTWDGYCEACHRKLQIVSEQYYVRNALEHLFSHHLVLKNTGKHPNTIINLKDSKIESLSPLSQDKVKNTQTVENSLKVRCLPGDKLSIHLNINNGSNNKRFSLLNSRISDLNSSRKRKVNTSEINSNISDNDDLNMWMKAKINCEVVLPNSEIFLEAGQQTVNNGMPIDGTMFCLIDTTYTKDYIEKLRDFPMNVIKTQSAFNEMSALPRLLGLFKCMDRNCTNIFSSKELFKYHLAIHFSNAEQKKKNQNYDVEHFKMCAYCFKMFDDEESLANHIAEKYTFCGYFCPHCFYRAYIASHVLVHQSVVHTNISKHCIIKLKYDDSAKENPKEMLLVVDFKEFILPYKCNVGCCGFSCYLHNEFEEHLNQKHQQCTKFCCYICANKDNGEGFFALHPSVMITHFMLHNLNKYQCIFCLFGSEIIDSMIKHLAFEHFEYDSLCLERSMVSDDCESNNIRNLKILRLKKVIDDGIIEIVNLPAETISEPLPRRSNKRSIKGPDIISIAMKSAHIEEGSQPLLITLPDSVQMAESSTSKSLAINNEFIIIDDDDVNQNDIHKSLKINRIWSESTNEEKKPELSSNDDIMVIDSENDVNLSEKEELSKGLTKQICLKDRSNKIKRSVFPIIELGSLFVCEECEEVFLNCEMYFAHLKNECPYWDYVAGRKCLFCTKTFKSPYFMTEHIKLHGPDRFNCYLCDSKAPSKRVIKNHMKRFHKIKNIDFAPEHPSLTDLNKDNFIVFEDKTVELNKQNLTCNKCPFKGNTHKIIISHMKTVHNAEQNVDCENNLCKIPLEQPDDTNNSFNSLMPQQNGEQSTRLNRTLKRKHSTMERNEFDKKIVEVAPDDSLNTEIFPQFIPINIRYKCSIPLCTYTGMTGDMLKYHISVLHPTHQYYTCPHCLPSCIISKTVELNEIEFHLLHHDANLYRCQYCEYIDFNRVEMRRHMRDTHLLEVASSIQSNIIIIRQTMLEDDNIYRAPINVPQWVCNICLNGLKYTINQITSHIIKTHEVSSMFKCLMCQFEYNDNNSNIFEEHYKLKHPNFAVKCFKVFEKITDNEEFHQQSKHLYDTDNKLEKQALENIEHTIMPPNCRGVPFESTPLKTYIESCGVKKSPKLATKKSLIPPHNQSISKEILNKVGEISPDGHFVCPLCNVFKTINIELFREHLYKELNYKANMWMCLTCFKISDSLITISWHAKHHGNGTKYEKMEESFKSKWVNLIIGHQHNMLLTELNKNK